MISNTPPVDAHTKYPWYGNEAFDNVNKIVWQLNTEADINMELWSKFIQDKAAQFNIWTPPLSEPNIIPAVYFDPSVNPPVLTYIDEDNVRTQYFNGWITYQETPTWLINWSNTVFTLSRSPSSVDATIVVVNWVVRKPTTDYTLSWPTITLDFAPTIWSEIFVYYNVNLAWSGNLSISNETPTGNINWINLNFVLANTPSTNGEKVYLNWQRLKRIDDYTISSNVISMNSPPIAGDALLVDYTY